MKKVLALVLTIAMATLALVGCGFDPSVKSEGVMTYEQYMAAELDDEVTIEAYVQGKQAWWTENTDPDVENPVGKGTFYLQDTVGGYFVYELPCTEAEYNSMTEGTRLKITGYKDAWAGEVEIVDAEFEILDGTYKAPYTDVTYLIDNDAENDNGKELVDYQNMKVYFTGMTVVAYGEGDDAISYKGGERGNDIYFNAKLGDVTVGFCIESYLTDKDTDVYKAVEALKVGDKIDVAAFLYWYNGANPHVTNITVVDAAD